MNIAEIDLNLLVVFDALMTERHVTRAGQLVGLSQPATSNALARLRKLLQDDLFVRSSKGLQPTPTALELASQIQPALTQIDQALSQEPEFDPATSKQTFAIGMSDYTAFMLLPKLLKKLGAIAPKTSVQVRSGERPKLLNLLDNGEVDVICGVFPEHVPWHNDQQLFKEKFVCVCRHGHPTIKDSLSLDDYVAAQHLLVSVAEDRVGRVDKYLEKQNLSRHVALSVPHFLVAPFVIAQTDMVVTLPEKVAQQLAQEQELKMFPMPIPVKGFTVYMRWHESKNNRPSQKWLRSILIEISQE